MRNKSLLKLKKDCQKLFDNLFLLVFSIHQPVALQLSTFLILNCILLF